MKLIPFSERYPNEFLSRDEGNFKILVDKLSKFHSKTISDIGNGKTSRRKIDGRFCYEDELRHVKINQEGISTEEVIVEFNDILRGCIRQHDPMAAFNIFPSPLFDAVAGVSLMTLYTPNALWDLLSGKVCLFEKKILRLLGQLVDWPSADGYVVSGGKQAILYAIKCGLERAKSHSPMDVNDFVVLTSHVSHFCVEHACHYLGIPARNCLRIETLPTGEIDIHHLVDTLERAISKKMGIAAIIAVGGTTINLVPDPILSIKRAIDQVVEKHDLNYAPFLHVDSVISWPWLAFDQVPAHTWQSRTNSKISEKIDHVLTKLCAIRYADSFAADFHKTGFCPYAASVFVVKNARDLSGLTLDKSFPKATIHFGEAEVYRQTIENSRPSMAIASIWITLRRLGLEGLREFILYQLEVGEVIKQKICERFSDHFEVLNDASKGWEVVFKPHFDCQVSWDLLQTSSNDEQEKYSQLCHKFLSNLWYGDMDSEQFSTPVIGFVKKYMRNGQNETPLPAFLIYPCSLHYDETAIDELLDGIVKAKIAFESKQATSGESCDDFLQQLVPPR